MGKLLALLENIRLHWKGLTGKNDLAYLTSSSVTQKTVLKRRTQVRNSGILQRSGLNLIKLFPPLLAVAQNRLVRLVDPGLFIGLF